MISTLCPIKNLVGAKRKEGSLKCLQNNDESEDTNTRPRLKRLGNAKSCCGESESKGRGFGTTGNVPSLTKNNDTRGQAGSGLAKKVRSWGRRLILVYDPSSSDFASAHVVDWRIQMRGSIILKT